MSITDYLKELTRLKNLAVNRWGNLDIIEKEIVESSFEWLVDNLDIKRGTIVEEDLTRVMDDFLSSVKEIINENKNYKSSLNNFIQDFDLLKKNSSLFYRTAYGFDIEKAGVKEIQKMF